MLKKKNKGFTLAELLIVVAIIAILVAISLPLFSSQIAKANLQADQTHVSAAKASAVAEYLDTNSHDTITYYFDAGIAMANKNNSEGIVGYGKSTKKPYKTQTGAVGVPVNDDGSKNIIQVIVGNNGTVMSTSWVPVGTNSNSQGGGGVQPTPVPTATPAPTPTLNPSSSDEVINQIITNAGTWPTKENLGSIIRGNVYTYNGEYYVAAKDEYNYHKDWVEDPITSEYAGVLINRSNPTIITKSDTEHFYVENGKNKIKNQKVGDLFIYEDGSIYICRTNADYNLEPKGNDNWILINTK